MKSPFASYLLAGMLITISNTSAAERSDVLKHMDRVSPRIVTFSLI